MPNVLAIDPGQATGWSRWHYNGQEAMQRLDWGLVTGGVEGFIYWAVENPQLLRDTVVIIEHYVVDGGPGEPDDALQIEGALRAVLATYGCPPPVCQRRSDKRQVSDEVLQQHDLWIAPSDLDWEDGRDVNDSEIHALAWAKKRGHLATIAVYWPEQP